MNTPDWPQPSPTTTYTKADARNLIDLFDVADEVYDGDGRTFRLTLADLNADFVTRAQEAATKFNLSWPPHMPEVEEYFNDHGNAIKASLRAA